MTLRLRVETVPAGEAPYWVREKWVGLTLPLAQRRPQPRRFLTSGVLSGPRTFRSWLKWFFTGKFTRETGLAVDANLALGILAEHNPEAAKWWRENAPHAVKHGRYFLFQPDVGVVIEA